MKVEEHEGRLGSDHTALIAKNTTNGTNAP
jgi:hypothetical protein